MLFFSLRGIVKPGVRGFYFCILLICGARAMSITTGANNHAVHNRMRLQFALLVIHGRWLVNAPAISVKLRERPLGFAPEAALEHVFNLTH